MRKLRVDPRIISKMLFFAYIVYSNVASYALFFIRGLSSVLLAGALVLEIYAEGFKLKRNQSMAAYILFIIYIIGSGFLVARNYSLLLSTALSFAESIIAFYLVYSYITNDKDIRFPLYVFIAQALLASIIVIFNGVGAKRISIAESVNVNTIGVMLAYAIGFILYLLIKEKQRVSYLLGGIGCIIVLLVGILLAVSKKGIFSASAMVIVWLFLCYPFTFKRINALYRILLFGVIITFVAFVFGWYTTNYTYQIQILKTRMSQLYSGDSDQDRIRLFLEGFSIFLSHPIFGAGFNNSRFYSFRQTYTHSFYSELFACTGFIGAILFLYALFKPFNDIYKINRIYRDRGEIESIKSVYLFVLFLILLVLCFVQILFYQPTLMYIVAIFTGYASIAKEMVGKRTYTALGDVKYE